MLNKQDIKTVDETIQEISTQIEKQPEIFDPTLIPIPDRDLFNWEKIKNGESVDWYAENRFWRNIQEYLISLVTWAMKEKEKESTPETEAEFKKYLDLQLKIKKIINKLEGMDELDANISEETNVSEDTENKNINKNINITITRRTVGKKKKEEEQEKTEEKDQAAESSETTTKKTEKKIEEVVEVMNQEDISQQVDKKKPKAFGQKKNKKKLSEVEVKIRNHKNWKLKKVKKLKGHVIVVDEEFKTATYWALEDLHLMLDKKGKVVHTDECSTCDKPEGLKIDPSTGRLDLSLKETVKAKKKERARNEKLRLKNLKNTEKLDEKEKKKKTPKKIIKRTEVIFDEVRETKKKTKKEE